MTDWKDLVPRFPRKLVLILEVEIPNLACNMGYFRYSSVLFECIVRVYYSSSNVTRLRMLLDFECYWTSNVTRLRMSVFYVQILLIRALLIISEYYVQSAHKELYIQHSKQTQAKPYDLMIL